MRKALAVVRAGRRESAGGRVRFSEAARRATLEHARRREAEGASLKRVAEETGVGYETLRRWQREESALQPVRIVDDARSESAVLVLPGGVRVEGLSVEALAALVRLLS